MTANTTTQPPSPSDVPTSERGEELPIIQKLKTIRDEIFYFMTRNVHTPEKAFQVLGQVKESLTEIITCTPKQQSTPHAPKQGDVPEEGIDIEAGARVLAGIFWDEHDGLGGNAGRDVYIDHCWDSFVTDAKAIAAAWHLKHKP